MLGFSPSNPEQNCSGHYSTTTNQVRTPRCSVLRLRLWPVDALQRKELEIVSLIEPRTLEVLKWQICSTGERERIDGELDVSVLFFPSIGLVIEDLQIAIADLQEVDMAGDEIAFKVELESAIAVVGDVFLCEVDRYFDRDGRGVVHEHESLERFMALLVRDCSRKNH